MTKNKRPYNNDHIDAELHALTTETMERVKDDQTLLTSGIYKRMMDMLEARFQEIGDNPQLPLDTVNDWLALALFMEDRALFVKLCKQADESNDTIYRRAKHWISKIANKDMTALARK